MKPLGVALLLAQIVATPFLLARCDRPSLVVRDGTPSIPAAHRVAAGREEWRVEYRGGHVRKVVRAVAHAPRQDLARPPCSLTVHVGQRFLDETIEPIARALVARGLSGEGHWSIGHYRSLETLDLSWAEGGLALDMTIRFSRAEARARIVAVPVLENGRLVVRPSVNATVSLRNWAIRTGARVLSYLDVLDKDEEATRQVARQLDAALALLEGLTLPSIDLPRRDLPVDWCPDAAIRVVDGDHAAFPLRLLLAPGDTAPVSLASAAPPPRLGDVPLALDATLDALNAILHHLFATGTLDALLAGARAADLFNLHPTVQELLTLRVAGVRFAAAPVIEAAPGGAFRASAELALILDDGGRRIPARLLGAVAFRARLVDGFIHADVTPDRLADELALSLALTCEAEPGLLTPCFADVVDAVVEQIRPNRATLHRWATARFAEALSGLSTGFALEVDGKRWRIAPTSLGADGGTVRLGLHAVP